ncbi:MAG: hypothetical protein Q9227_003572 [Pyrenula ochraceoflavens]
MPVFTILVVQKPNGFKAGHQIGYLHLLTKLENLSNSTTTQHATHGPVTGGGHASVSSLDALRIWIEQHAGVAAGDQILMTGRGRNVKPQRHITPFDEDASNTPIPEIEYPPTISASDPPSDRSPKNDLPAWQDLFRARKQWSEDLLVQVRALHASTKKVEAQTSVICRAAAVAMDNMRSHVANIQNKFAETRSWAQDTLNDQDSTLTDWQSTAEKLRNIPVHYDYSFLLQRPPTPIRRAANTDGPVGSLYSLLDIQTLRDAATHAADSSSQFRRRFGQVEKVLQSLEFDTRTVDNAIKESESAAFDRQDEIEGVLEEVNVMVKKIVSDHNHLAQLSSGPRALTDASRLAHSHTKDLLPALLEMATEATRTSYAAVDRRNASLKAAMSHLQNVSSIQSGLTSIQARIQDLDLDATGNDAFYTIDSVFRIPTVYGSLLLEAIRRREWDKKISSESEAIAEDVVAYRDEEEKRRKRWVKSMAGFVRDDQVLRTTHINVELQNADNRWPSVSRQDVVDYIHELQANKIDDNAEELGKLLQEFDAGPKQKYRPKAFKNGSLFEAGQSAMLRSEDGAIRLIREEKTRLEEKLKSSESRVRKLEDLMHRQGSMSRPVSGNFAVSESERQPNSPLGFTPARPDIASRRSSVSSRRLSSNQNLEERHLVQRIVSLEAEVIAERETVTRLQREAHAERRSSSDARDRMEEAESTKKDLLANLESLQSEFEDERQLLEDESHKLKIRLEEAEEEIDRLMGSRDHEKLTADRAIQGLQDEVSQLRRHLEDQKSQAEGQVDFIRNDFLKQREKADHLERQLLQQRDEYASLQAKNTGLAAQLGERDEYRSALEAAHSQLSPEGAPPADFGKLVRAIEILSEGLSIHARSSDDAANRAAAECRSLEEKLAHHEAEIDHLKTVNTEQEQERVSLKETLMKERSLIESLRLEVAHEQAELDKLRSKFAAGETGSDALKDRVATEELRVAELSEKLAVAKSHAESFEQEISIWRAKVVSLEESERQTQSHHKSRGEKAQELSQRLLAQNERFVRLLEQMGFVIMPQVDGLRIQRASKVSTSVSLGASTDTSVAMNRTLSGSSPSQHYIPTTELENLYWVTLEQDQENANFDAFLTSLSRLDLDNAIDLIAKRYKDVETLAKKFQRDSRAYREKSHRAQAEGHDKIAYRSFKEGDLALFLPTRNQATRPWAAFNVGAPHYFLREQDGHKLQSRDWLLARISRVEERVVDLSRSMANNAGNLDRRSLNTEASEAGSTRSIDDDNPFELSDGLRWYMIDAAEEKPGAPSTPGMGKSTVASSKVDATGSVRLTPSDAKKIRDTSGSGSAAVATKNLSRGLDSRRSSSASKKGPTIGSAPTAKDVVQDSSRPTSSSAQPGPTIKPMEGDDQAAREDDPIFEEVRKGLWFGP